MGHVLENVLEQKVLSIFPVVGKSDQLEGLKVFQGKCYLKILELPHRLEKSKLTFLLLLQKTFQLAV